MAIRPRSGSLSRITLALAVASLALGLMAVTVFALTQSGDYRVGGAVGGDNAAPAIASLLHGSVSGYLSHQPIMGLTSILVRLPVAGLASALGAGNLTTYELGALACVLPLALMAAWLVAAPGRSRDERLYGVVGVMVLTMSPILRTALAAGHPEGVLAGLLGTVAVLVAIRGRVRTAAILLGLAIGSQEWAVIAAPPVLIALPGRRREVFVMAAAAAALLTVSVWMADPSAFLRAVDNEGATRFLTPLSLLWPVSMPLHLPNAAVEWVRAMPLGMKRPEATFLAASVVGALGALWYLAVRRRVVRYDPLALLALLGLLRCVCDSTHEEYYGIAALIPIVAWEAKEGRLALIGTLLSVSGWAVYGAIGHVSATELYTSSLGMKALLVGYFASRAIVLAPRTVVSLRPAAVEQTPLSDDVGVVWCGAPGTIPVPAEAESARAA